MCPTSAVANSKDTRRDAAGIQDVAGEHEERDGEERKAVDPGRHPLHDDPGRQRAARQEVEQRARDQRKSDRKLEGNEAEGDDEEEREVHP